VNGRASAVQLLFGYLIVRARDVFASQTAKEAGTLNTPEAASAESAALHGPMRIWVVNRGTGSDPYTGMKRTRFSRYGSTTASRR
jgi:hypothetical protein